MKKILVSVALLASAMSVQNVYGMEGTAQRAPGIEPTKLEEAVAEKNIESVIKELTRSDFTFKEESQVVLKQALDMLLDQLPYAVDKVSRRRLPTFYQSLENLIENGILFDSQEERTAIHEKLKRVPEILDARINKADKAIEKEDAIAIEKEDEIRRLTKKREKVLKKDLVPAYASSRRLQGWINQKEVLEEAKKEVAKLLGSLKWRLKFYIRPPIVKTKS